ncbi:hypothetical protein [Haloarcula vallismortis]|nr:hypothetical protein [Haloarcula vallismortis]
MSKSVQPPEIGSVCPRCRGETTTAKGIETCTDCSWVGCLGAD